MIQLPFLSQPFEDVAQTDIVHLLFLLQNSASHSSSSEVDEGPAAKLARFTNDLIAENCQRRSINTNQSKRKLYDLSDGNASDDDVSFLLNCIRSKWIFLTKQIAQFCRMIVDFRATLTIQ